MLYKKLKPQLAVALLLAGATSLALADKASLPAQKPFKAPELSAAKEAPSPAQTQFKHRVSGTVSSLRKAELSFRVPGFIKKMTSRPGAIIKSNEILAELDDTDFALEVEMARIQVEQAKEQLNAADKEYQRELGLKQQNASTGSFFDKIDSAYKQAKIALKLAEAKLRTSQNALAYSKLRAPYDCIVAENAKDEGEFVSPGTKVFHIYEKDSREIDIEVPERLITKLQTGSEVAVRVPSLDYAGTGKVVRLVPVVSEKTRTFRVSVKLDGDDERVVPGLFAEALFN